MGIYQKLKVLQEIIKKDKKNKILRIKLYIKEKKLKDKLHKF